MHVYTSYKPHFRTHHSEEKLQVVSMLNCLLHFYKLFVWSRIFSLYILSKKKCPLLVDVFLVFSPTWMDDGGLCVNSPVWLEFVCPANQHLKSTIKKTKSIKLCPTCEFLKKLSAMFDNQKILLFWTILISLELPYIINKPLTSSRCVICISCSVRLSQCTTHAKDHRFFILITD